MRVTESLRFDLVSRNLASLRSAYYETAQQASSGQRITAPSDDPIGAAELARVRASLSQIEGHQRTMDLVRSDAESAESTLAQITTVFQRAREIAMQGANGSNGPDEFQALSIEAQQLLEEAVGLANTRGTRGYLFSGTAVDTATFDQSGNFLANDGEQVVQVTPGESMVVNASGARAFTIEGGRETMSDLQALVDALSSGDTDAVSATLDGLKASEDQITRERARVGLTLSRFEFNDNLLSDLAVELTKRQSNVGEVVPEDVYSRLTQLQESIQNAVLVGQKLLSLSSIGRF